jgi:hypothetical protein
VPRETFRNHLNTICDTLPNVRYRKGNGRLGYQYWYEDPENEAPPDTEQTLKRRYHRLIELHQQIDRKLRGLNHFATALTRAITILHQHGYVEEP